MSDKFTFSGVAIKVARQISESSAEIEVGVWTDGIGIFSDNDKWCAYRLVPGKRYKITIEPQSYKLEDFLSDITEDNLHGEYAGLEGS